MNDIPRRAYVQKWTAPERAIKDAVRAVEAAGAHPLLTDAIILLQQAFEKIADYTDQATPDENPEMSENNRSLLQRHLDKTIEERAEAQEAAETYWEAWQDAAVYWKGQLCDARQVARLL